ncbi:unnamed protein product, partial [Rotaria sp. Silwood2]
SPPFFDTDGADETAYDGYLRFAFVLVNDEASEAAFDRDQQQTLPIGIINFGSISFGLIGFLASLALQLWIFLGAQITKNQIPSKILELTIDNCTDPVNITNTTTTTLSPPTIKQDPLIDFYSVSYMWYTTIAVLAVLIVGVIVSYLTHPLKPNEIDPKLIIPIG